MTWIMDRDLQVYYQASGHRKWGRVVCQSAAFGSREWESVQYKG